MRIASNYAAFWRIRAGMERTGTKYIPLEGTDRCLHERALELVICSINNLFPEIRIMYCQEFEKIVSQLSIGMPIENPTLRYKTVLYPGIVVSVFVIWKGIIRFL